MPAPRAFNTPGPDEPASTEPALCALLQTLSVDRAAVALSPVGLDVALAHLVSLDAAARAGAGRRRRRPAIAEDAHRRRPAVMAADTEPGGRAPAGHRPRTPGRASTGSREEGAAGSQHSPSNAAAILGAAVAVVLLAGCANLEDVVNGLGGGRGPRTVAYECDDDERFVARFSADRDEVRVRIDDDGDDDTYDLGLVDRDGGRRVYSEEDEDEDDSVRLTVSDGGREAYLRIPDGADLDDCEAEF